MSLFSYFSKNHYLFLIVFLLLAAFAFRLWTTQHNNFLADNLYHFLDVKTLAEAHHLPVVGPIMTGPPPRVPGGFYYHVLELGYVINPSIPFLKYFSACFIFLFLPLLIFGVARKRGHPTAFFLTLLLIANPVAVIHGSDYWNANFIFPPLVLLLLFLLEVAEVSVGKTISFLILPLVALIVGIHFANLFVLVLPVFFWLLWFRKNLRWSFVILGGVVSALMFLPYALHELNTGFSNSKAMLAASKASHYVPPKLYGLFIFPTNEFSAFLGSGWPIVRDFYFANPFLKNGLGYLSFGFNLLSLLGLLCAWVVLLRDFFSKRKTVPDFYRYGLILASLIFLSSYLIFTGLKMSGGGFHYFFALFPLSFFPLLYLYEVLLSHLFWKRVLTLFYVVNVLVLGLTLRAFYFLYYDPISYDVQIELVKKIEELSAEQSFVLKTTFENQNDGVYQQFGFPRFYQAISEVILKKQWNEKIGSELEFAIDTYDPAFTLKHASWFNKTDYRLVWENRGMFLYQKNK